MLQQNLIRESQLAGNTGSDSRSLRVEPSLIEAAKQSAGKLTIATYLTGEQLNTEKVGF